MKQGTQSQGSENPEGWGGEGGGRGIQDGETRVPVADLVNGQQKPQYCKEISQCFQQHFLLHPLPLVLTAEPAARFLPEALKLPVILLFPNSKPLCICSAPPKFLKHSGSLLPRLCDLRQVSSHL